MWGDEARDEEQGLKGTRLLVLDGLAHISHQVREGGCGHRRDVLEGVGVTKNPIWADSTEKVKVPALWTWEGSVLLPIFLL